MTSNFAAKPRMGAMNSSHPTPSSHAGARPAAQDRVGSRWQTSQPSDWKHKPADAQQTLFAAMKAATQRRSGGVS
jgi:hypothetical protein